MTGFEIKGSKTFERDQKEKLDLYDVPRSPRLDLG